MNKTENKMELIVTLPDQILFEGKAIKLVVPAVGGIMGILPHHQATISMLESGELEIIDESNQSIKFSVEEGVVEIRPDNKVIVLLKPLKN